MDPSDNNISWCSIFSINNDFLFIPVTITIIVFVNCGINWRPFGYFILQLLPVFIRVP